MPLPVPSPANGVAGVDISAAFWNAQVRDALNFLLQPPLCVARQNTAQAALVANTWTPILLDTNVLDPYSGHSTTTNTSRYYAQVAGWYDVSGVACYSNSNTTGFRSLRLAVNGTVVQGSATDMPASPDYTCVPITPTLVFLNVGDYVQMQGWASVSVATAVLADLDSQMCVRWRSS